MTMGEATTVALEVAERKRVAIYVLRDTGRGGYLASAFCDGRAGAVVGVVLPNGEFHDIERRAA